MALLRRAFYIALFAFIIYRYVMPSTFVFKVKTVKDIGRRLSGSSYTTLYIRNEFMKQYPKYVLKEDDSGWLPCNTGGLHGSITILYASLTEFLALYRAELETTGTTGRHYMNVSMTVLRGDITESTNHVSVPREYIQGDNFVIRAGQSSLVKMSKGTTLLLYGRGFLPLSTGYWLSETLFVHADPLLAFSTLFQYTKAVAMSNVTLWKQGQEIADYLWKKFYKTFEYLWRNTAHLLKYWREHLSLLFKWLMDLWDQLMSTLFTA